MDKEKRCARSALNNGTDFDSFKMLAFIILFLALLQDLCGMMHTFSFGHASHHRMDTGLKLKSDHLFLNPYSKMRVPLAAKEVSESVSVVLNNFGSLEFIGTAKILLMVDKVFDCLNV